MSAKEIAISVLSSEPCLTLLPLLEAVPGGARVLNRISRPRSVFTTFEEAWAAARKRTFGGHEHPDYIKTHLELSKSLRSSDYPVLYWLSQIPSGNLRVFDFGGNVGNLYYPYTGLLRDGTRVIDWIVFDLPKNVEEGRRIAIERAATGLNFTRSLKDAENCNVLLCSGAFHYWERSVQAFLEQFPHLPEHIIVNRTPVLDTQPSFITVQHRESYAVPCIVRNAAEVISAFADKGYAMVDRWAVLELALRMPLFPKRTVSHYSGFYFVNLNLAQARASVKKGE